MNNQMPSQCSGLQMLSKYCYDEEIIICPTEPIPFNHPVVQLNGIFYENDQIKITEPGTYLVSWEVIVRATNSCCNIVMHLEDCQNPCIVYGKAAGKGCCETPVVGTALVQVNNASEQAPFCMQLVNRSCGYIIMSGITGYCTQFSGSLTVAKLCDFYMS